MRPLARTTAACGLAVLAIAGCGEEDPPSPPSLPEPTTVPFPEAAESPDAAERLTPGARRRLLAYDRRIAAYCARVTRGLVEPDEGPTPVQQRRAFAAAEALIDVAARKPAASLGAGQDARLFVSDLIENLEGSNCDPRMRSFLERGLERIPAP